MRKNSAIGAKKTELIEKLDWDSGFFGLKIGRFKKDFLLQKDLDNFKKESRNFDCVYLFLNPLVNESYYTVSQLSFLGIDTKIVYELKESRPRASKNFPTRVITNQKDRLEDEIIHAARDLSTVSRFYFDKDFRKKAKRMYGIWAKKLLQDKNSGIVVSEENNKLLGFVGYTIKDGIGDLVLVYTAPEARGKGVANSLVNKAIATLKKVGAKKIIVKSQVRNVAAARLYRKCGFITEDIKLIYHAWNHKNEKR